MMGLSGTKNRPRSQVILAPLAGTGMPLYEFCMESPASAGSLASRPGGSAIYWITFKVTLEARRRQAVAPKKSSPLISHTVHARKQKYVPARRKARLQIQYPECELQVAQCCYGDVPLTTECCVSVRKPGAQHGLPNATTRRRIQGWRSQRPHSESEARNGS